MKNKIGKLTIYSGPMFSGKTNRLIVEVFKLIKKNKKIIVFKTKISNRIKNNFLIESRTKKKCFAINIKNWQDIKRYDPNNVTSLYWVGWPWSPFFDTFFSKLLKSQNFYIDYNFSCVFWKPFLFLEFNDYYNYFDFSKKIGSFDYNHYVFDVLFFEEAQFFDIDFVNFIDSLLDNGIDIYIAGLDKGFSDNNLPVMNKLFSIADNIEKFTAKCEKCGEEASKTQRVNEKREAIFKKIKQKINFVGGKNLYEPRCRKCFVKF